MLESEFKDILGRNLKDFRKKNNWIQSEFAKKLGMTTNFIYDIEKGKKWPSMLTILKMANMFEVEPYQLFMNKDEVSKDASLMYSKYNKEFTKTIRDAMDNMYRRCIKNGKSKAGL